MGNVGSDMESGDLVEWFGVQGDAARGSEEWLLEQWIEKKKSRRFNSSRYNILRC